MKNLDGQIGYHPMASGRTDTETDGGDIFVGLLSVVIVFLTIGGVQLLSWAWAQLPRMAWAQLPRITPSSPKDLSALFGVALASLALGRLLYSFKVRKQFFYGLVEIGVGAGVAVQAWLQNIEKASIDPWSGLLALLGGIYIVVRGFDNISQYKKKVADEIKKSFAASSQNPESLPP